MSNQPTNQCAALSNKWDIAKSLPNFQKKIKIEEAEARKTEFIIVN